MKSKKLTNAQFLKKVEELKTDKGFTYTDDSGKIWTGEMARAKYFGMTRAVYRAKLKEAQAEMEAKKPKRPTYTAPMLVSLAEKAEMLLSDETFSFTDDKGKVWKGETAVAKFLGLKTAKLRLLLHVTREFDCKIMVCDKRQNGRYYVELPDGYRLIYNNKGYVGRYDPKMDSVGWMRAFV